MENIKDKFNIQGRTIYYNMLSKRIDNNILHAGLPIYTHIHATSDPRLIIYNESFNSK